MTPQSDDLKRLAEARGDGMSSTEEQELDKAIEDILVAFDLAEASPEMASILEPQSRSDPATLKAKSALKSLLSQHTQRARVEELSNLRKELEMVPFDPTGTIGFDKHMISRTEEEVRWAKDKNFAASIASIGLQEKIDARIAQLSTKDSTNKEEA